ncbi:MAG: hypothetical protein VX777_04795 [Chlamydiota bacterium]|nr:hypothetical protein [Chlamydiota bacterium]
MEAISSITIGEDKFELGYSSDRALLVIYNGREYHAFSDLVEAAGLGKDINNLAQVICFAHGENNYRFITDIPLFKTEYESKINKDKSVTDIETPKSTSWGTYDISELSAPSKKEGELTFYAENKATGVPYRVRWEENTGRCFFELLKSA